MSAPVARIAFAGDLVPSVALPDPIPPASAAVFSQIAEADLGFADLEMPLSAHGYPVEKLIAFRGSPALADDLPRMGFDVLSLATNHSMDHGPQALADTIAELERVGIETVGAGPDLATAERLLVRQIGEVSVGFLAWSCLLPTGSAATAARPGVAPIHVHTAYEVNPYLQMEEPGNPPLVRTRPDDADLARAADVVREARRHVDFLVVSMHWGFGATAELAEYQPIVGRELIDAGADFIIGAHVHALQGLEVHRGRVIAYGVGNFVAQQPREGLSEFAIKILDEMSKDAALALLEIHADGTYDVAAVPVTAGEDGLPCVPPADEVARMREHLADISALRGTAVELDRPDRVRVRGEWGSIDHAGARG